MGSETSIINKYRPAAFDEVLGNEKGIASLRAAVTGGTCPHGFLFSGPSGIGKTTLARIIATEVNGQVEEMDAATNSGVDATKAIVELSNFTPLFCERKVLIIDECHAISKQGWQPLLKLIEEPPAYLYIVLCTTELAKVPETIRTRCFHLALKPCKTNEIEDFVTTISEIEGWTVTNDVLMAIVQASTGQPRKALSLLQAGHLCTTRDELSQIVAAVESDSSPAIGLMQYLLTGGKHWGKVQGFLTAIEDDEEAWATATRFLLAVMLKSEEAKAQVAHRILDALTFPRSGFDRKAQFAVCITAYLWN